LVEGEVDVAVDVGGVLEEATAAVVAAFVVVEAVLWGLGVVSRSAA
jgi:hypothetical protein